MCLFLTVAYNLFLSRTPPPPTSTSQPAGCGSGYTPIPPARAWPGPSKLGRACPSW